VPNSGSLRRLLGQPVLWLLIYGGLIGYGVYAFLNIPVEVLPAFNHPQIRVIAHYPGATAEEIEAIIARPLEGEILSTPDLVEVRSTLGQGTVAIDARFREGTSARLAEQAVNSAVDRARGQLPSTVDLITEVMGNAINEVADYVLRISVGVAPAEAQRAVRANVLPALRALPGVQRAEVFGSGEEALWIQPDLHALRHYGISLPVLADAVRRQVLLSPSGYLVMGHQDVFMEARNLPTQVAVLAHIRIPAPGGDIPLQDLARIVRTAVPTHNAVSLDGRPSIALTVFKQPGASTVPVTEAVATSLARLQDQLPPGAHWVRVYSQGHLVRLIGDDLGRNLLIGGVLAVAVLFWILGAGRGIWALAISIPLSLLLGIAALYVFGESLNLLTLGALTVAVGLLADDAIIVLESIYHRWEQGDHSWSGVWSGVRDIAGPDVTGTLTVVSVFLPLLFVGGLAALFFVPFALAMSLSMLASLFISLSFIPLALGFLRARPRAQVTLGGRWVGWLQRRNEQVLNLTLRRPRLSLIVSVVLLGASVGALAWVPVNFLPLPNESVLLYGFTLPPGSSLEDTQAASARIARRLRADPAVADTFTRVGSPGESGFTERSYAGEVEVALKPTVDVGNLDRIGTRLLESARTDGVQLSLGTPTVERVGESLSGLPQPFVIRLFGERIDTLRNLSEKVVKRLQGVATLTDVFNNDGYPVTHLEIRPDPTALAVYGITPADLYAELQPALTGQVLARVPDGNSHVALYLRLARAPHLSLAKLRHLLVHTSKGWTPLGSLAQLELVTGPNQIRHLDGARAMEITATPLGPLGSTIAAARQALAGLPISAGYRIEFGGLFPELEHAALALAIATAAAFVLMMGILVLQFGGLLVPGILLLQMPLAFTGGAFALGLSGVGLNATGLVAFLTLIGISLRQGIVLLHRAQHNEASGMTMEAAVREAVRVRFRPILLTTLTAALGMLPTALGWGRGAAPEQGLALVILGGLLWSAMLSTNLLPALYLYWGRNRKRRERQMPEKAR
jgi:cobalt-zinc-cadmium resistance protein CzcA